MNILDENIIESQRQLVRSWRIRIRQIGHEVGRPGMPDQEILPLLRRIGHATFFTRDLRLFDAKHRARDLCVVCLAVGQYEVAVFVRKLLRHPALNTRAKKSFGLPTQVSASGRWAWAKNVRSAGRSDRGHPCVFRGA